MAGAIELAKYVVKEIHAPAAYLALWRGLQIIFDFRFSISRWLVGTFELRRRGRRHGHFRFSAR